MFTAKMLVFSWSKTPNHHRSLTDENDSHEGTTIGVMQTHQPNTMCFNAQIPTAIKRRWECTTAVMVVPPTS